MHRFGRHPRPLRVSYSMQVNDFLTDHLEGWHSAACVPKKPLIFHSSFAESREWWITHDAFL